MPARAPGRMPRVVLVAASVYVVLLAGVMRNYFVDDAYIGFRCIENLVDGQGLVFNPGQCAEAVTNVGWLLVLAPLALVLPVTFAAKLCGALLVLLTAVLVGRIALRLTGTRRDYLFVATLPLLVVACDDFVIFSLSGMETGLLAAGLCWMTLRAFDDRRPGVTALLGALLFLIHYCHFFRFISF